MNPITNTKNLMKLNEREMEMGLSGTSSSWHNEYKDSAWIFVGGLPYDLTEGDILCVFSQYGEIVNINLVRDHQKGKSKGFCFICYEDQRSTILAVDNLNGTKILQRMLRVDHVLQYRLPKDLQRFDEEQKRLFVEGCAPKSDDESESNVEILKHKEKKKKRKKEKKSKKRSKSDQSSESDNDYRNQNRSQKRETDRERTHSEIQIKRERSRDRGRTHSEIQIKQEESHDRERRFSLSRVKKEYDDEYESKRRYDRNNHWGSSSKIKKEITSDDGSHKKYNDKYHSKHDIKSEYRNSKDDPREKR